MKKYWVRFKTLMALGLLNVLRVLNYRLGVALGYNPVRRLSPSIPKGSFFDESLLVANCTLKPAQAWLPETKYFGHFSVKVQDPPDWFLNPFSGVRFQRTRDDWWKIPDFDPDIGDIKIFWEASRFDWCLSLAQQAKTGNKEALGKLNSWLINWLEMNPPYYGPNWKCGQEASIRVLHLFTGALILGQVDKSTKALLDFVEMHLERIAPTVSYAIAQNNNHGTSEAAALFLGGTWLTRQGRARGRSWQKLGHKLLENRVKYLVAEDGSFSQYSLNYHRMMLDTLCLVEVGRRHWMLENFSTNFYNRAKAATLWLYHLADLKSGDGPNFGANDGARIIPLTDTDYRDFRPSIQLSTVLFLNQRALKDEMDYNLPLRWLGIQIPESSLGGPRSLLFDKGGLAVLHQGRAKVILRYPRFQFRPSQADVLHVDLWVDGENLLRDAGTFSYLSDEAVKYFSGTISHNTIQFDQRDQMPRLSRFLFGNWLKTRSLSALDVNERCCTVGASYRDAMGATHSREISLERESLKIEDSVSGFKNAVLRWRLPGGNCKVNGQTIQGDGWQMRITGSMNIVRFEVTEGWESLYYFKKTSVPVLEIEISEAGTLRTEFTWGL